jgi:hypothetical protein
LRSSKQAEAGRTPKIIDSTEVEVVAMLDDERDDPGEIFVRIAMAKAENGSTPRSVGRSSRRSRGCARHRRLALLVFAWVSFLGGQALPWRQVVIEPGSHRLKS